MPAWVWAAAIAIPLLLVAPAIWNGYPLLQWDTGGYLARWYEGYLVPSRSTVFGLYLHFGEGSSFWINLGIQALATLWILQLTLRVLGMAAAVPADRDQHRAGPGHGAALARQHAADRHLYRAVGARAVHPGRCTAAGSPASRNARCLLSPRLPPRPTARRWRCCSGCAASAGSRGHCCASGSPPPAWFREACRSSPAPRMLLSANFALSGELAWTPGGYGVAFGRMLQDGIVKQYLRDHCPQAKAEALPVSQRVAGHRRPVSVGQQHVQHARPLQGLERRDGLHRAAIARRISGVAGQGRADRDRAGNWRMAATGEGTNGWIPHTYGIIERYIPAQIKPMRAANQQRWRLDFTAINRLHVPVALASMLAVAAIFGIAIVAAAARRPHPARGHGDASRCSATPSSAP